MYFNVYYIRYFINHCFYLKKFAKLNNTLPTLFVSDLNTNTILYLYYIYYPLFSCGTLLERAGRLKRIRRTEKAGGHTGTPAESWMISGHLSVSMLTGVRSVILCRQGIVVAVLFSTMALLT